MNIEQQEARTIIQMDKELELLRAQVEVYQSFTNAVDDYFEYRCKSEDDQREVHRLLGRLTDLLTTPTK